MRVNVPPEEFFTDTLEPKILQIQSFDGRKADYSVPFDEYLASDTGLTLLARDFAKLRGSMYVRVTVEAISVEQAQQIQRAEREAREGAR